MGAEPVARPQLNLLAVLSSICALGALVLCVVGNTAHNYHAFLGALGLGILGVLLGGSGYARARTPINQYQPTKQPEHIGGKRLSWWSGMLSGAICLLIFIELLTSLPRFSGFSFH